ncbi:conserved hypothetical protein [Verrucomicrobia bacterium]|nr:conserved hypothetical protein [Verrucomicrobiota bacterium]
MKGHPKLKIVSGGQTGADRAALDWAIKHGVPHGGWCPAGRRAEDGVISRRYKLRETKGSAYAARTAWNVRDSDGTVILSLAQGLSGGARVTRQLARKHGKPCLHLSQQRHGTKKAANLLCAFLQEHRIRTLNVAGPRASKEPKLGHFVTQVLDKAFLRLSRCWSQLI